MRRVSSRLAPSGSKACIILAGGFEAFRVLFPFVCTQSDIRSVVDREKFLTIYPSVVLDNQLYIGNIFSKILFVYFQIKILKRSFFFIQALVIRQQIGKLYAIFN